MMDPFDTDPGDCNDFFERIDRLNLAFLRIVNFNWSHGERDYLRGQAAELMGPVFPPSAAERKGL